MAQLVNESNWVTSRTGRNGTSVDLGHIRSVLGGLDLTRLQFEHEMTLPAGCYTDPTFYEFEKECIFRKEWLCLGHIEQIPKRGDNFTITVVDEPLVVIRSSDDEVRVMSAVCRHRGMIITGPDAVEPDRIDEATVDRSGHCDHFRCPYHHWVYDLDGKLLNAPAMERTPGFDPGTIGLPVFRSEIWEGLIFVNFDAEAPPLAPRLKRLTHILANWHLENLTQVDPIALPRLPWNWKVMHENSIENYHTDRLHQAFSPAFPSDLATPALYDEGEAAIIQIVGSAHFDHGSNPTFKALLPIIPTLTEEERWGTVFALVPPTLLLGAAPDSAFYRIVLPRTAETISTYSPLLLPKTSLRPSNRVDIRKMMRMSTRTIVAQDIAANANVQKGLHSQFAERSRYSWQESPLPHFNRWLLSRYLNGLGSPTRCDGEAT